MNYRQANAHYEQEARTLSAMLEVSEATQQAIWQQYETESTTDPMNVELVARLVRSGFAGATSINELLMAYANAFINYEASKGRLGGQRRAEAARQQLLPRLQAGKQRVQTWRERALRLDVTLPEERDGVLIALIADAELRDIYRAASAGRLSQEAVAARVADVTERFHINPPELAAWRRRTGIDPAAQ